MRKPPLPLPLLAAVAALLPLADHADQATCCNATTSLASTVNNPVAGDEAFFKLPSGPSNVMFLVDTSGSMSQFPQCGDWSWDDPNGLATCKSPTFTLGNPPSKSSSPTYTVTGTCTPDAAGLTTSTSSLKWMEAVTPQAGYADPGRTNALLWDCPAWGNGGAACGTKVCSGSGCLFDPTAYYTYGDWSAIGGAGPGSLKWYPTTTQRALDAVTTATTAEPTAPCTALDANGNVIVDAKTLAPVSLGDACTSCMTTRGFFLYRINYYDAAGTLRTVTQPLFKGTFLNANPPKFVTARKVLKDVAWMDPAAPRSLDQIRLGLSVLDSGGAAPRKARLIVPLGPDKGGSYPPTQAGFRQARQYLLSVLNYDTAKYTDASGNVLVDGTTTGTTGFQNGFFDPTAGSTPLGSALFNVGQYFTAASPPWTSLYAATFGASGCGGRSCVTSEFAESSAGRTNAAWVTKAGNVQQSICWGCQASSVVVVTDGSPNIEISFPSKISTFDTNGYALAQNCNGTYAAETFVGYSSATFRCIEPNTGKAAGLPRVADWLHTQAAAGKLAPAGLRYDLVLGGGQKAFTVDTIGVNVTDARAVAILNATANLGGGIFQNAADPGALASAVYNAVSRVTPKDISFSSASSNSLQTVQTSASQAFITRFRPNTTNTWEGHSFEAFVFDEFQAGCDPCKAVQPTVSCGQTTVKQVSADFNGDGQCGGTFLVDQDCDEIVEDTATGNFLKKGTTDPANLWDAGQVLSFETFPGPVPAAGPNRGYRTADETAPLAGGASCPSGLCRRNVFTWIGGARVELTTANAATLLPYLNISSSWCTSFLGQIGVSGGANPTLECAKEIIHYVRGWDVLDQDGDGCAGPGKANGASCQRGAKGEERDRPSDGPVGCTYGKDCSTAPIFWKLGDVSHSSPAVIQVPIHESVCASGWENQCTWAIYGPPGRGPPTKMDASCTASDCYLDWRTANLARPRVELVGANDGMLHAFDAGAPRSPRAGAPFVDYTNGTGAELWAFVPPDLLPRLKDLLSAHQYMVDGSVMLRDVWVDGTKATDGQATPGAPNGQDGQKQVGEFHTVAVFGRRSGGNQTSALDVTDPLNPTFLWNFPRGGSTDARYMGQSWSDFAPRPPPIVPVRLAATESSPRPDRDRGFSERWVVLLGGGYDPTLTLGRAVFMLDVWTGATLWRFTDDDFKASMGYSSASAPSLFPVTAVGAVDLGDPAKVLYGSPDADSFFDTATWGDLAGNVWVARFDPPGAIDPGTGRVGNWFAARTFEQLRRSDDAQVVSAAGAGRNEFFYMPANTIDPEAGALYTFLGSGNREQLLSQGPSCGTDNLMACCQAGCSVSATSSENYGAFTHSDAFACTSAGLLTHGAGNVPAGSGDATCAAAPGNLYSAAVNVAIACPGAPPVSAAGSASCDGSGLCTVAPVGTVTSGGTLVARSHNRFYGIKAFGGGDPAKSFGDLASARTFERNRSTDVPYDGTCAGASCTLVNTTQAAVSYAAAPSCGSTLAVATTCADGSAKCTASPGDAGWFYELGDRCPVGACPTPPPWTDEKVGSGANVIHGCAMWGGFRPHGTTTSSDPCSGTQGTPTVYDYAVNTFTGAPDGSCSAGYSGGVVHVASQRSVTAAPGGVMARVDVNAQGRIGYSGKTFDSGSSPGSTSAGTANAGGTRFYWLEVPRQLHACRHVDRASCE